MLSSSYSNDEKQEDFTAHSLRVRFDAKLRVMSQKGVFPSETIASVFVTNRDGCTHHEATVDKDGIMRVDYEMRALHEGVRMTDRVKLHFFFRDTTDQLLKPICAGHLTVDELIGRVEKECAAPLRIMCNFNNNVVEARLLANGEHGASMRADLVRVRKADAMVPSVLGKDTKEFVNKLRTIDDSVKEGLHRHMTVSEDNGGNMFQSLFSAHTMENEATLYTLYHHDFDNPQNVPPWLCTYLLGETMHHNAVTPEQIKAMDAEGITHFIASYAQAPMRSATATPYTDDLILNDDPKFARSRRCTMLSEVFKRPFCHPYHVLQGHGCLIDDDCEGLAALMRDLTNHLGFVFTAHREDLLPILAARGRGSGNSLAGNVLMQSYFPEDLFSEMPTPYRVKVMDLALHLGEYVANKKVECKITLVSAMGAAFGEGGQKEIQAHACASLQCNIHPTAVMLEGTACMVDDHIFAVGKKIKVGDRYLPLVDIANSLTQNNTIGRSIAAGLKCRMAMHITHSKGSFYRSAFCQNGTMLGSQIGSAPMQFGVDMEYLSDEGIKIHLPVTGKALGGEAEYAKLVQYVQARSAEIHPPLVDHHLIRSKLNWAPMTPFTGCAALQRGRPFLTCMVHLASDDSNAGCSTQQLLVRAQAEADEFNNQKDFPEHLGVMRAVATMDGVSKLFHIYVDDLSFLQRSIAVDNDKRSAAG